MAILIEAISVIIREKAILEKYPNGILGFMADITVFNAPWHKDENLFRVGFFDPNDMYPYLRRLEERGLVFTNGSNSNSGDFCIVDMMKGTTQPCDWLKVVRYDIFSNGSSIGRTNETFTIGWLKDEKHNYIPCNLDGEFILSLPKDWAFDSAIHDNRPSPLETSVKFFSNQFINTPKPVIWQH